MQRRIYYIKFAQHFAVMSIAQLVSNFNDQVQNRGWSSMRAYHDCALIDAFRQRGIDISCIHNGYSISFTHRVEYDAVHHQLITIA